MRADVGDAMARAKAGAFVAAGEVACAQEVGETLGTCTVQVARDDEAAAAAVVTFPNGFARILTFDAGAFLRGNTTMSGVGTDTDWSLNDGLYRIRVDDQRFEIPETLIIEE
ncbi:MAG: hypothetical protein AAFY31_01895 [Pseudomonadota bacterium]